MGVPGRCQVRFPDGHHLVSLLRKTRPEQKFPSSSQQAGQAPRAALRSRPRIPASEGTCAVTRDADACSLPCLRMCSSPLFIQKTGRSLFIVFPGKYCSRLDQNHHSSCLFSSGKNLLKTRMHLEWCFSKFRLVNSTAVAGVLGYLVTN